MNAEEIRAQVPGRVRRIEDTLAGLLEEYARLRECYIEPAPDGATDDHLRMNLILRTEANAYRQAAYLLRNHRDQDACIGLPVRKWHEWDAAEKAASRRLDLLED